MYILNSQSDLSRDYARMEIIQFSTLTLQVREEIPPRSKFLEEVARICQDGRYTTCLETYIVFSDRKAFFRLTMLGCCRQNHDYLSIKITYMIQFAKYVYFPHKPRKLTGRMRFLIVIPGKGWLYEFGRDLVPHGLCGEGSQVHNLASKLGPSQVVECKMNPPR